jgi:hypothetical protein
MRARALRNLADQNTTTTLTPVAVSAFDQIIYWLFTSADEFDLPSFRAALPDGLRASDDTEVRCSSREGAQGPYHAYLGWQITGDALTLTLDYHSGGIEVARDETEPFAEDLMRWLAQYFSTSAVIAHAHVRIRYETAKTTSRLPLALTSTPPYDAELYGVALQLKERPNGALSVRLTRGQSYWYAEVVAEREIVLNQATPLDDVGAFRDVLSAFLEERSP